jgi:hypothetical protein
VSDLECGNSLPLSHFLSGNSLPQFSDRRSIDSDGRGPSLDPDNQQTSAKQNAAMNRRREIGKRQ